MTTPILFIAQPQAFFLDSTRKQCQVVPILFIGWAVPCSGRPARFATSILDFVSYSKKNNHKISKTLKLIKIFGQNAKIVEKDLNPFCSSF